MTTTYVSDGDFATPENFNAWLNAAGGEVFNVKASAYGAVGDGVTDDTAAILAALTAATPTTTNTYRSTSGDGGAVYLPPGIYAFSSSIAVPEFVNLVGAGDGLTVLLATHADAQITFGSRTTANRGGQSGGFIIDGADVATNPLFLGKAVQRVFQDITVHQALGDGIVIEGAQNNLFNGVNVENSGASNWVWDYGAGNNIVVGSEVNQAVDSGIEFRQSGTSPTGAFSVPTRNRYIGCMIERFETAASYTAQIVHTAGRDNTFDSCDISMTELGTTEKPAVLITKPGAEVSSGLRFHNCSFLGTASYSTVLDAQGNTTVRFSGYSFFENHKTVFYVEDSVAVEIQNMNEVTASGVDNLFVTQGGSKAVDDVLFRTAFGRRRTYSYATTDYVHDNIQDGESNPRFRMRADGRLEWGTGASGTDVYVNRSTAASVPGFLFSGPMKVQNTNAAIFAGTGAPTVGASDGSIYLRTDGGAGTAFYVRENGAWVLK